MDALGGVKALIVCYKTYTNCSYAAYKYLIAVYLIDILLDD